MLTQPGFLSPYGNIAVDVAYLMAALATAMFVGGWWMARNGKGAGHRRMMISAAFLLLGYFFAYYLLRGLGSIAAKGKYGFGGPEWIVGSVIDPLLSVHIILVLIVFLLIPYQLWLGRRAAVADVHDMRLSRGELRLAHGSERKLLLPLFVVLPGIAAWRCESGHCWLFYIGLLALIAMAIGLERLLERLAPEGGKRHRIVGAVTLCAILLLFASTTAMYAMLHVLYPHAEG
ncbi:MAG: DUF420 domain-containing protein [Mariprofundaceae bacterium]